MTKVDRKISRIDRGKAALRAGRTNTDDAVFQSYIDGKTNLTSQIDSAKLTREETIRRIAERTSRIDTYIKQIKKQL